MSKKIKAVSFWFGFWSNFASGFDLFGASRSLDSMDSLKKTREKNMAAFLLLSSPKDALMKDIERLAKDVDKLEQDSRRANKSLGPSRPARAGLRIIKDKVD